MRKKIFTPLLSILCATVWGLNPASADCPVGHGDPNITAFALETNTGYHLIFRLFRQGDKIGGMMTFSAAHQGDEGGGGVVNGHFNPDGTITLVVNLQAPAPTGDQLIISGKFSEGDGRGTLRESDWKSGVPDTTWIARTPDDCPKWPNGPVPIKQLPNDTLQPGRSPGVEALEPPPKLTAQDPGVGAIKSILPPPLQAGPDPAVQVIKGDPIPSVNAPIGVGPPLGAKVFGNNGGGLDTSKSGNVAPAAPSSGGAVAGSAGGGAAACPPGAVLFNGSCNSGGAYQAYPGGTSVNSANKSAGSGGISATSNPNAGAPANGAKGVSVRANEVDPKVAKLNQGSDGAAAATRKKNLSSGKTTFRKNTSTSANTVRGTSISNYRSSGTLKSGPSSAGAFRNSGHGFTPGLH